jgi:hypothetical protein
MSVQAWASAVIAVALAGALIACGGSAPPVAACTPDDVSPSGCDAAGLVTCAADFVDADGVCRPSVAKCAGGTVPQFEQGCVAVGPSCPADFTQADGSCAPSQSLCSANERAAGLRGCIPFDGARGCGAAPFGPAEAGASLFVDASASAAGADGSTAHPFTTIAAAVAGAKQNDVIALAAGRYAESFTTSEDVTIVGRCPSKVVITGDDGDASEPATVHVTAHALTLDSVQISGDGVGVLADGGASAVLTNVVIAQALGAGVRARGMASRISATDTLVTGTRSFHGNDGEGGDAQAGGAVTFTDSALVGNRFAGLRAEGANAAAVATGSLVEGTLPSEGEDPTVGGEGEGMLATKGATLDATRSAIVDNQYAGIEIDDAGTHAQIEATLVRETQMSRPSGVGGYAFVATNGAAADVTSSALVDNETGGIGTDLATLVIEDTLQRGGVGLLAISGGAVKLRNDAFVENQLGALYFVFGPSKVDAFETLVEDTKPDPTEGFGAGIIAGGPQTISLASCAISSAHVAGMLIADQAKLDVTGSLITGTKSGTFELVAGDPPQQAGDGLVVTKKAHADVTRTRFESCARVGVLFDSSSGSVTSSLSTNNEFGLVVDGSPTPTIDAETSLDGNSMGGEVDDSTLPVPNVPPAVPE